MKRVAYNQALDAKAKRLNMIEYVRLPFSEHGRSFPGGVLQMRDAKYKQYGDKVRASGGNILAVRYEDLASDPEYVFEHLAVKLPCNHGPTFLKADGHSKFGVETDKKHEDAKHAWTHGEWGAVLAKLDRHFETSIGFGYLDQQPGAFTVHPPDDPDTWLTLPHTAR